MRDLNLFDRLPLNPSVEESLLYSLLLKYPFLAKSYWKISSSEFDINKRLGLTVIHQ